MAVAVARFAVRRCLAADTSDLGSAITRDTTPEPGTPHTPRPRSTGAGPRTVEHDGHDRDARARAAAPCATLDTCVGTSLCDFILISVTVSVFAKLTVFHAGFSIHVHTTGSRLTSILNTYFTVG